MSRVLKGKTVVIAGGSSGMGKAIAREVLRLGARTYIVGRSRIKLDRAVELLGGKQAALIAVPMDMMNDDEVTSFFQGFPDKGLDHLVITASEAVLGSFRKVSIKEVRATFESKYLGPYRLTRAALDKMATGGSITFFSGGSGKRPGTGASALASVNAAVESLARALAVELGPDIRVNCCSPGVVKTEIYDFIPEASREKMYQNAAERLPVKRVGTPEEIARAVLFLMTSGFTTGTTLHVDGGYVVS
ncbi:MAG: SDR family oxidoreductase [Desulfobacterales bacterium]|jgi:NAD(P)-dependent dehydrogenase (short-subunit alcohol dehydrogenase family)|nr:SDR family oxidoreductase [Desulfobacterales bacterium]